MTLEITLDAVRDVITSKYQDKSFDAYDILAGLTNLSAEWIIEERYDHTKQLDKTFNLLTDLLISGEIERGDYCKRAVTFTFIQPDWDEIQASYIQMISTIAHQLIYEKENLDPLQLVYEAVV
jgi:hypothetical protein